jgi:hypothetical protein
MMDDKTRLQTLKRLLPMLLSTALLCTSLTTPVLAQAAVDEYDSFIFNLGYPDFDALRSNPRFIELCEQLRMPCAKGP